MAEVVDVRDVMGVSAFAAALSARGVRVGRQAVWRWVRQGRLDYVRVQGRYFVRSSEVERVLLTGLGGGSVVRGQGLVAGEEREAGKMPGRGEKDVVGAARLRMGGRAGAEAFCRLHGL